MDGLLTIRKKYISNVKELEDYFDKLREDFMHVSQIDKEELKKENVTFKVHVRTTMEYM